MLILASNHVAMEERLIDAKVNSLEYVSDRLKKTRTVRAKTEDWVNKACCVVALKRHKRGNEKGNS